MRYYLGSGNDRKKGFIHVDMYGTEKSDFILWDLRKGLPSQITDADCFFMSHTNEHLSPEVNQLLLKQCYERLSPGGKIYIEIPDQRAAMVAYINNDHDYFDSAFFRIHSPSMELDECLDLSLYQRSNQIPEHIIFISDARMLRWLTAAGFDAKQTYFDPSINNPDPIRVKYSSYFVGSKVA